MDNNDLRFFDDDPELQELIGGPYSEALQRSNYRPPLTDKDWGKKFGGFSFAARAAFAAEKRRMQGVNHG